ncbi:MAG: UDP-N-acetylmuramoylalanyl-D-glutamyl-2,6-diaminopimelate--D-alanyl-D-alanine ligase [Alphaproteobacteria bacterium]|nr:UDP-N-acetylmuramoylalanyl-D-glutamyl-2,6-diaminopimelate--D-alanyl-D-alanine ligase [Alphaproteobacteria bacterium]
MTRALWTSAAVEAATGGRSNRSWHATGVSIDSRTLQPGDLFVALRGDTHDGHDHVAAAVAAGASAVMVSRARQALPIGTAIHLVDDTLEALTRLGAAARARTPDLRAVAVTGSVGKTSTKEALRLVLAEQAPTHGAAASFNNHIGVPVTLARLPVEAVYAVFEIGMNHAGEISPLVRLVRPEVAVITTIAAAHTQNFPDGIDGVAAAKAEIFEAGGRAAVINRDIPHYAMLAARAAARGFSRIVGFGADPAAELRLVGLEPDSGGSAVAATIRGRVLRYRIGAPGRHWAMNSLAVLAAVEAIGADVERAAVRLADVSAVKGRGRQQPIGRGDARFVLIDESYNANPTSMRAAFDVLAQARPGPAGRRIAVLGDMLELGPEATALHAELCEPLVSTGVELVFTCGPEMAHLHAALPAAMRGAHAPSSVELAAVVAAAVRGGDVVMVKGSLGSRMSRIVEALLALDVPATGGRAPRTAG